MDAFLHSIAADNEMIHMLAALTVPKKGDVCIHLPSEWTGLSGIEKITMDLKGEFLELKDTINTMVDRLRSFASSRATQCPRSLP